MTAGQFAWTVTSTGDNAAEAAARLGIPESGLTVASGAAADGQTATMPVPLTGASFSNDDAGKTYTYQVSETKGGDEAAGYTNDATVYTVTIAPTFDTATGVLSVTTTVDGGTYHEEKTVTSADATTTADPVTVPFANSYQAQPGSLGGEGAAKIAATKQLTNRPMTDGEFTFAVTNAHDTASPAAVVAAGSNAVRSRLMRSPTRPMASRPMRPRVSPSARSVPTARIRTRTATLCRKTRRRLDRA